MTSSMERVRSWLPQPSLPEVWTCQLKSKNISTGLEGLVTDWSLGCATSFYDHEFDSDVAGLLVNLWTKSGVEIPEFMGKSAEAGETVTNEDDEW